MYGLNWRVLVLVCLGEIKPALERRSEFVHVKQLEAGQDIGYGQRVRRENPNGSVFLSAIMRMVGLRWKISMC